MATVPLGTHGSRRKASVSLQRFSELKNCTFARLEFRGPPVPQLLIRMHGMFVLCQVCKIISGAARYFAQHIKHDSGLGASPWAVSVVQKKIEKT